jgi:hypothetical protein
MSSAEIPEKLQAAAGALERIRICTKDAAWLLLEGVNDDDPLTDLIRLKENSGLEGDEMERLLIWHAAQRALPRIPDLPVVQSVRTRLDQDLRQLHNSDASLSIGSYSFLRAAKMATLRRFPAGPMEWESDGIPRSYFVEARFPANLRMAAFAMLRMGGIKPCFFMHLAPSPRNRGLSVPKEVLRTYHRMVRSMKLQPKMRGLIAHAWFHDPAAVRDNPHLEVLSRPYLENGGLITLLGTAPASSGVLQGNAQRGADYLAGKVQYRFGFAIWPRSAAIDWADKHPELSD